MHNAFLITFVRQMTQTKCASDGNVCSAFQNLRKLKIPESTEFALNFFSHFLIFVVRMAQHKQTELLIMGKQTKTEIFCERVMFMHAYGLHFTIQAPVLNSVC